MHSAINLKQRHKTLSNTFNEVLKNYDVESKGLTLVAWYM